MGSTSAPGMRRRRISCLLERCSGSTTSPGPAGSLRWREAICEARLTPPSYGNGSSGHGRTLTPPAPSAVAGRSRRPSCDFCTFCLPTCHFPRSRSSSFCLPTRSRPRRDPSTGSLGSPRGRRPLPAVEQPGCCPARIRGAQLPKERRVPKPNHPVRAMSTTLGWPRLLLVAASWAKNRRRRPI